MIRRQIKHKYSSSSPGVTSNTQPCFTFLNDRKASRAQPSGPLLLLQCPINGIPPWQHILHLKLHLHKPNPTCPTAYSAVSMHAPNTCASMWCPGSPVPSVSTNPDNTSLYICHPTCTIHPSYHDVSPAFTELCIMRPPSALQASLPACGILQIPPKLFLHLFAPTHPAQP